MPRSNAKTVLFAQAKDGRNTRLWPVAVFPGPVQAKGYATILRLSYRAGDMSAVKKLDPGTRTTEAGELLKDVKFSLATLPYNPIADIEEDDAADVSAEATPTA